MRQWTANQLVAYNLVKARELRGLTQEQAVEAVNAVNPDTQWSKITWSAAERSFDWKRVRQFTADDLAAFCRAFDLPWRWWLLPPADQEDVWFFSDDPDGALPNNWVMGQIGMLRLLFDPMGVVESRLEQSGFSGLAQEMADREPDLQRWHDIANAVEGLGGLVNGVMKALMMRRRQDLTIGSERREREAAYIKRHAPSLTTDEIEKIKQRASERPTQADLDALGPGNVARMRQPMVTADTGVARELGETVRARAKQAATEKKLPTKQSANRRRTTRKGQ